MTHKLLMSSITIQILTVQMLVLTEMTLLLLVNEIDIRVAKGNEICGIPISMSKTSNCLILLMGFEIYREIGKLENASLVSSGIF